MRPSAGTALGGRYRLDRLIAVGGMGEVWVAHDLSLRRDVAVKVLREEFAGDAGFLERFRTEARNAASLSHPNIAATYDYGEQDGSSYLVMELVVGEPLSDLLEREPVLPEQRLLPVLAQTARALHAAHLAGVVHRDVKPGNILLGPGGRVKITDFGVSTAPDQAPMTATGMVMGTAQYLSPEQAVGRPATASSDLYSLGVVAYESLAGHRPFTGPTAVDIAVAHVNDPVPPLPGTVSPPVAALVLRLLAKDPADRPPSAGALARLLDGMVGHTPPDGVPVGDDDEPVPAPRSVPPVTPAPRSVPPVTPAPAPAPAPPVTARPPVTAPPSFPPRREIPDPRGVGRPAPPAPAPGPSRDVRHDVGHHAATGADRSRVPAGGAVRGRADTAVREGLRPRTAPAAPPAGPPGTAPHRPARSEPHAGSTAAQPVRTSTTTGRRLGRFGRWSWPLVALVALVLALLVAALADSVGGAGQGTAATASVTSCPAPTASGEPAGVTDDGMISACVPSAGPGGTTLSTAKDA